MSVIILANERALQNNAFTDKRENIILLSSIAMLRVGLGMGDVKVSFISEQTYVEHMQRLERIPAYEFHIGFDSHHSVHSEFFSIYNRFIGAITSRMSLCQISVKLQDAMHSRIYKIIDGVLFKKTQSTFSDLYHIGLPTEGLLFTAPNARSIYANTFIYLLETVLLNILLNEISANVDIRARSNSMFNNTMPQGLQEVLSGQFPEGSAIILGPFPGQDPDDNEPEGGNTPKQ